MSDIKELRYQVEVPSKGHQLLTENVVLRLVTLPAASPTVTVKVCVPFENCVGLNSPKIPTFGQLGSSISGWDVQI